MDRFKFIQTVSTCLIVILGLALAGCSKFKSGHYQSSSSSSSQAVVLTSAAYQSTVYAYVKTIGCAQCHANGPTASVDWFVSANPDAAFQSALNLVNISNPSASPFAVRISNNHCGFASICGISNRDMITAINQWIKLSSQAPVTNAACSFNGQTLASGASTQGYSAATVPFGQSCDSVKISVSCSNGNLNPVTAVAACSVLPGASCSFNGQTLATGGTVQAYQTAMVPFGSTCMSETRTCTNGVLSGSNTFASCTVGAPATCTFNNMTIPSAGTATGYPSATVPFGQTCKADTITCTNGVLNPPNDVAACTVQPPANCTFNGMTITSGATVKAYQAASVPSGQTCTSETRTCTNGTLSGSYTFASCAVNAPATCTFNGMTIQNGGTVTGFPSATVPFGQTCKPDTITCTNGTLSLPNDVPSCKVLPGASCTFNGQTIASGGTVTGYPSATVPFGQTCKADLITCTNGVLSPATDVPSCTVQPGASCSFNGQTIASGGTTTGYPSATVPFGQTCKADSITCTNGMLTPANDFATCAVAPPVSCSFNGQSVASGSSVSGYASATVPAGQVCSQIQITCTNASLSPASASPTCSVASGSAQSVVVPTNDAIRLRLNAGLTPPGKAKFVCQNATNCSAAWANSGQFNVNFNPNPNASTGAGQVSFLAFAACNDVNPADWGVNTGGSLSSQTTNLINAGIQMVNNHTGGLGSNSAFQSQVSAVFQTLISDSNYSSSNVKQAFLGICTAAQTFGIGMKGF